MFSVNDFFKILSYLKGDTVENLDEVLQILSKSEQATSSQYFQNIIDQNAHMSPDYLRLRNLLIDWYASHKTILGVQKKVSDVFSIPDDHIDELIRSFGFDGPIEELTRNNKINFFYDLVNLYKIKGSPESIIKALSYFGLSNVDIVEYWLQKNEAGELVFAGEYSIPKVIGYSYMDVPNIDYESMTVNDPHWMISKEDAEVLVENNKIALPSRSPYFGIVPGIYLDSANLTQSIIVRVVEDEYAEYLSTGTLNKTVKLTNVKYIVSLLELYLACIYAFITYTGRTTGSSSDRYFCYDGAYSSYQDIVEIWNYYVTYRPTQRSEFPHVDERVEKITEFYALFSRDISENFLIDSTTAGTLLNSINPELKISIDSFFTFGRGFEILSLLIKDLSDWASDNIGAAAPNMSSIILGLGSLEYVKNIIKFFKPYRARFVLITTSFIIKNPLTDSIVIGDNPFIDTLQETIIDFDTADSAPGYLEGFFPEGVAVQSDPTPPEQRIFNIYVDSTGDVRAVIEPAVTSDITQIYSDPPVDCYRVANVYLEDYGYDGMYNIVKKLYVEYYDTPETIAGVATPIYSMPPSEIQFYQSHYLKIDVLDHLVITYDETQQYLDWPIDVVERRYYSRELMDCGSWFDIGASCDFEQEHIPEIREEIHDYYNIHRYGAEVVNLEGNVDGDYTVDSTGDVNFAMQCGGFVNFDIGWLFDSPFANDICYIEVIDSTPTPPPDPPVPPAESGVLMGISPSYYEYDVDAVSGVGLALYDVGTDTWTNGGVQHDGTNSSWPNTLRVGRNFSTWFGSWWKDTGYIFSIRVNVFEGGSCTRQIDLLTDDGATTFSSDCHNCMDMDDASGLIACLIYIWTDVGAGLYKWCAFISEDRGATWKPRYDFPTTQYTISSKANIRIDASGTIWASMIETDGDVIYIYKSVDVGDTFTLESTVSTPVGTTQLWNFRYSMDASGQYHYMIVHTTEPANVMHLYSSSDYGVTWTAPANLTYPGYLMLHTSNVADLIILYDTGLDPEVFKKSTNSGGSFIDITPPVDINDSYSDMQRDGANVVYTDGGIVFESTWYTGLIYSLDSGTNWQDVYIPAGSGDFTDIVFTDGYEGQVDIIGEAPVEFDWSWIDIGPPTTEAYQHFSTYTSGDVTSFIVDVGPDGTDPGMAKTIDNGETWAASNLGATPTYFNVTGRDFGDGTIYLVYAPDTSDGIIFKKTIDNGLNWTEVVVVATSNYGEGLYAAIPSKNVIYFFYSEYGSGDCQTICYKSTNGGTSWASQVLSTVAGGWDEEWHHTSYLDENNVAVIYEHQYHDVDPQWKREIRVTYTTDGGSNWNTSTILTDIWGYDYEYILGLRIVWYDTNTMIACANIFQWPENHGGNTAYFGVWRSTDGGANWSGPTKLFEYTPNYGGNYSTASMKIQEDGNVWISYMEDCGEMDTWNTFSIWKSTNVGSTWQQIYQNQFDYLEVYFWNNDMVVKSDGRIFVYCCAVFDNQYLTGYRDSIFTYAPV